MRRFLYLFIIIAVIALIVLIGYFLRRGASPGEGGATGNLPSTPSQQFPKPSPGTPPPSPAGPGGTLPQTTFLGQKFGVVAQNQVLNFFVDSENSAVLVQPDGQVVKITNGEASVLSSSAITNLREASFSYDGKKILAVFGNQSNPQASIFDVSNRSWQPLQLKLKSAVWSPSSYQVAYLADNGDAAAITTLDVANPKAKPQVLARLHIQDVVLGWPAPNKMIIADKASVFSSGSIWNFDVKQKTLTQLVQNKPGLESVWSGGAELGLIFETNPNRRGGKLGLVDRAGSAINDLAFLTLPSKCAFDIQLVQQATSTKSSKIATSTATATSSNKFLYCAVPLDQRKLTASELPDDYEKRAMFTTDDFFRVNLNLGAPEAGNIESVFSGSGQPLDATDLKIFNHTVFFINRLDQKLYAISLK